MSATMTRDIYAYHNPLHQAGRHFVMAEHCERMKMACAGNPELFYKYAECEYYHKALAHRYKGIAAAEGM
ncbi:hypothetical protein [Paenibacillus sp. OAS669]|uniref:hypothetical protein n=1 Tax=Paenibacillus sp. OAS669 TaxID=2663821 RepID=UPI0019F33BDA|nr:hypothetical protein [Paenibacillus sp. OAS669]MBE1445862.1 hypothetical protein [Paenibacillus sp. OAS669]